MIEVVVRWCRKAPPMIYRFNTTRHLGNRVPGYVISLALIAIVIGTMAYITARPLPPPPDYVAWETDLAKAVARAQQEDKPILRWQEGSDGLRWEVRERFLSNQTIASLLNERYVCLVERVRESSGGFTVQTYWGEPVVTNRSRGIILHQPYPQTYYLRSPQEVYDELLAILEVYRKMSEAYRRSQYEKIVEDVLTISSNQTVQVSFRYEEQRMEQNMTFAYIKIQCSNLTTKGYVGVYIDDLGLASGRVERIGDVLLGRYSLGESTIWIFQVHVGENRLKVVSYGFSGQLRYQIYVAS